MIVEGMDSDSISNIRIGCAAQLLGLLACGNVWHSPEERLLAEASLDYLKDVVGAKVTAVSDIHFPEGTA